MAAAGPAYADPTYTETVGGLANTWTNPTNAGGYAGPQVAAYQTVQVACKTTGFRVQDGNTWWYLIASSPWNYGYFVSADAFYNNGATSGSLRGTPFVDPVVRDCTSGGVTETAGGLANTWTNYANAGGTAGPQIGGGTPVQIACKVTGFRVADGNTWWYQVASAPWNGGFYVSADAFYNNGATSGSLSGTPYFDPAVPDCSLSLPSNTVPTATLARGPAAPSGYRYAISINGFAPSTQVTVTCMDSTTPGGFYSFVLKTSSAGAATTSSWCYSGSGPDHWFVVNDRTQSNHVQWGAGSNVPPSSGTGGGGTGTGSGTPGTGGTIANPTFNRNAARNYALAHAQDAQTNGTMCTLFVSRALQAGGFSPTPGWYEGGITYSNVEPFVTYFRANASSTWTDITGALVTNAVPQALVGDVIVYDWEGDGVLDHMSLVTDIGGGQYPLVSEMGQFDFTAHPWYKLTPPRSSYVQRGWTWSQMNSKWLQQVYGSKMRAYLLHLNGGYFVGSY